LGVLAADDRHGLDRPAEVIPARWMAVRLSIAQMHHARIGVTAKTLSNHKSNVKAALRWLADAYDIPQHGARLSPDWTRFYEIVDKRLWERISNLARFCAGRGSGPSDVNNVIFADYWRYRAETTGLATHNGAKRLMVRAWNIAATTIHAWPLKQLTEPAIKMVEPAWDAFPIVLRHEIETFLAGLAKVRRTVNGKRLQPCSPTTINNRRGELVAMARMAVRLGVPIASLDSLAALLHPDVVEKVIDAYWKKNGEEPKIGTIDLGWKVLRMARQTGCLDQAALERLDEIRITLEQHRHDGLTQKNLQLIRQVLTDGLWSEVVSLPHVLMEEARAARDHAPIKAAVSAQLAVAIAILVVAPIRLRNLIGIELGRNLIKPGGLNGPYWLTFPQYDVKNRVDLNFRFDQSLTDLIDEYVNEFRPVLLRGANTNWLFPGEFGQPKHKLHFSKQITFRIQKTTGLRITVHQFRHAAAAIWLKHHPGSYEHIRRVLGHRNLTTTVKFYCGLETIAATDDFAKLIRDQMKFDSDH
jgi:integrase